MQALSLFQALSQETGVQGVVLREVIEILVMQLILFNQKNESR